MLAMRNFTLSSLELDAIYRYYARTMANVNLSAGGDESLEEMIFPNGTLNNDFMRYSADVNGSAGPGMRQATTYPVPYRVVGTILHAMIFVIGFFGNVMICVVVRKTKALHTPTYCYLVRMSTVL